MGRLLVHEFATLDGVVDTPTWTADYPFDEALGASIGRVVGGCSAIVLGRRTYEMFAPAWSSRTVEDDPGAPFFNDSPKYVVSSTLRDPAWHNTTVLGPYDAQAIRTVKQDATGDVYVSGSISLVRAMLRDGLVDRLHLYVYPVVLGAGLRLFAGPEDRRRFTLVECEPFPSGIVHAGYEPVS